MLKKERQAYILRQTNLHNKVLVSDLAAELEVSEDTIRRDLIELDEESKIIKVHGGALSKSFQQTLQPRQVYEPEKKRIIAEKTIQLLKNDMFILTTGGTTIIEFAKHIPQELKATFITPSLPAAFEYTLHPNIEVIMIGDKVSKNSQITVGAEAIKKIGEIRADLCIMGINALDEEHGITDNDWEVSLVKKAMIESSKELAVITIAEKLNSAQKVVVCAPEKINYLITEKDPSNSMFENYKKLGIKIL